MLPAGETHFLKRNGAEPLHAQISRLFRQRIVSGEWPEHYKLHSEENIAQELEVNRGTVRRAIRTLIEENLVQQVQGRGTFVVARNIEPAFGVRLKSMAEELQSRNIEFETVILDFDRCVPDSHIARLLDLASGEPVWFTERLRRRIGGEPLMLLHNWISTRTIPRLEKSDIAAYALFDILEKAGETIAVGRRTITAENASADLAELLRIDDGTAVLHIEQTTYSSIDRPLEFSDIWLPPARVTLNAVLRRD